MAQTRRDRRKARRPPFRGSAAALWLGAVVVSFVAASCGSSASTHTAQTVLISTSQSATNGTILVDGNTLYTLKPSETACTAECLKVWPALLLPRGMTAATAGPGVSAAKLGTVAVAGGALQVTYSGQALYFFARDRAAGQVSGNVTDKWGAWADVVTAVGAAASAAPASGAPVTSTAAPGTALSVPTTAAPPATTAAPAPTTAAPAPTTTAPASGGAGF
jgi:predicted lipoprotein with Yx(FWY)xxD motif